MTLIKTGLLNGIAVLVRVLTLLGLNKVLAVYVGPAGYAVVGQFQNAITMFTALASLFSNRSVSKEVAMTGEVTLRGLVLPIGGLKEKSIAALRAGIKTIIIPKLNEKDISDLPDEVRQKLRIVLVETVDEVLAEALVPGPEAAAPHHSGLYV